MKIRKNFYFIFFLLSFCLTMIIHAQDADLIIWNGKIITVDAEDSIAEAVAVKDSFIIAVGTNQEIEAFRGPDTEMRNLNGRCVTPGMIDAHLHLQYYGQTENDYVNLRPPHAETIEDVVNLIAEEVAERAPGDWIMGDGFFKLEDMRLPNKDDLDPVSPDNPVFLNSMGGHYGSCNSMALEIAGIDSATPDPAGGLIERDSLTGHPTGVFWNHPAMDLVRYHIPPFDEDELAQDVIFAQDLCLTTGITSYQDVNTRGMTRLMGYYNALDSLKARAWLLFTIEKTQDAETSLERLFVYNGDWLSLGGDKFLLDGQPPTSYTYEPHPGPSWNFSTWNKDTLEMVVKKLHRAGHQLAFHAMGDAAIDMALDAIEAAQADTFREDHRHRIEHCMIPTAAALQRIKDLEVVVSIQPSAIYASGAFYYGYWGPERIQRFKPMKTMLDMGIPVALGTDYPTIPYIAPKYTLWSACVRRSESGVSVGSHERVTIQQALYAHTMGSAYAAFQEDVKGSIEVGKYADMVVWSDDLYSIPVNDLKDIYVISTLVGGTVYNNPNVGVKHQYQKTDPDKFTLHQNYPNPFNAVTNIVFDIPYWSHVQINILDIRGRFVKCISNKLMDTGKHTLTFEANDFASGIYFVQMKTKFYIKSQKIILIK